MKRVVSFSGGLSSWATAKIVAESHGAADLTLLFADTLYEDADLYRFLDDAAKNIGVPITRVCDGRTIWQVFRDTRFLGNNRVANCSQELKKKPLDAWVRENCDPADTVQYVGFRWDERQRWFGTPERPGFRDRKLADGWVFEAPLIDRPHLGRVEIQAWAEREGLDPPRTYDMDLGGNCGGRCVRAGQKHWATLLREMPERFDEVAREETAMREFLGKDVAILRDRRGGTSKPMPLTVFRERMQAGKQCENDGHGGCQCMQEDE